MLKILRRIVPDSIQMPFYHFSTMLDVSAYRGKVGSATPFAAGGGGFMEGYLGETQHAL